MNVLKLLNYGSESLKNNKISTHSLDSEILLSKILKKSREEIILNFYKNVQAKCCCEYKELIIRRLKDEPIAYILQEKEFWSKNFKVDYHTLIPRPETELLVEKVIQLYKNKSINILDIGTGSGCIIVSILIELPKSKGVGIDISSEALKIASYNASRHKVRDKIRFYKKSIDEYSNEKFDLIVSNPPYIKKSEIKNLDTTVRYFEPKIALDGGNDGLDVIRKVIYKANNILKTNGRLALEIGNRQLKEVSNILTRNNFIIEEKVTDFKDNVRCLISKIKR